jgi:hypothetical protein
MNIDLKNKKIKVTTLKNLEEIQYCKDNVRNDRGYEQPLIPFHFLRHGVSQNALRHLEQVNGFNSTTNPIPRLYINFKYNSCIFF